MSRPIPCQCHEVVKAQLLRTLVSGGIALVEFAHPLQELLGSPLLKHAHEGRTQSFTGIRGHLGDGGLGTLSLLDVAARNLLELEVSRDIGGNQNVGQVAIGHQQLGNQVDVPVVDTAILLPGLLAGANVAVLLKELQGVNQLLATLTQSMKGAVDTHSLNVNRGSLSERLVSDLCDGKGGGKIAPAERPNLPSVVIITVNVKDLVSLDTQNTAETMSN